MVFGKIKPTATIVAQFAAGVEVEAIQHEGRMYLPVVSMGEFATSEPAPEKSKSAKKDEPAPAAEKSEKSAKEAAKTYTKDELMETDSKELVKILKNEFGINPDDHDGKNTNKKLRDLILDAQKNGGKAKEAEQEDDEKETSAETTDDVVDQVATILEDFDAGKKNKKKAISAICALADDADDDKVTELVEEFEDDADADIDDMASKIADVLAGKKSKKTSKKETEKETKKSKKSKKEDLVDPEDLEVGDRVSVWWDDDNQDWFDGEVKSIKKGKITIAYDDDTEEVIDPEVHTKIKRIAE